MFHTGLWFEAKSLGDLTSGQLAFITSGLERHFKEEAKRYSKKR